MENNLAATKCDYLFDGVHQALTFAYRYSGQQYSPSVLAQFMARSSGAGKGLSGLDGAAQAGIVRAIVGKLDIYQRNMIAARFAADDHERIEARLSLVPVAVANMGTGMYNRRAADALVQKFFGLKIGVQDVAAETGLHRNTISPSWKAVRVCLYGLWERSEEGAHRELREAGLIP
jgi:hypothetical protein